MFLSKQTQTFNKLYYSIAAYQCGSCDECFESTSELGGHITQHHTAPVSERIFKRKRFINTDFETCIVCGTKTSATKMDNHLCVHEKSVSCEYCAQEFSSIKLILEHLEVNHDDQILHSCTECSQSFRMQLMLDRHRKYHTRELMEFVCTKCSLSFPCAESLEVHERLHENKEVTIHLCELCGKSFSRASNLRSHLKTHGEHLYKCPDCPGMYKSEEYLVKHRKIHSKIKDTCNVCGVEMYPKVLQIHMRKLSYYDLMGMFHLWHIC